MPEVKISCQGVGESIGLDQLQPFQERAKTLHKKNFEKLKASILEKGLLAPVFVWVKDENRYILDGHQRRTVLVALEAEGYTIPPIPVVTVEAEDFKDATERMLMIASQYGYANSKGFQDLMKLRGVDPEEIGPKIDIPRLKVLLAQVEEKPEVEFTQELMEAHNYVVLYFDNEMDWIQAKTVLGLKSVKSKHPSLAQTGVGKVLRGADVIKRLIK